MFVAISIFGRGRSLTVHDYDVTTDRLIYFRWTKLRRGKVVRAFSIQAFGEDGGLAMRISHEDANGRWETQGWALRGPLLHLES